MVEEKKVILEGWGLIILEFGRYRGGGGGVVYFEIFKGKWRGVKMFY